MNPLVESNGRMCRTYSGSISSVSWMFEKKGRIQFRSGQAESSMDDMMDLAIEAGAEDMQELEDNSVEVRAEA